MLSIHMENKKHYIYEVKPICEGAGSLAVLEENNQIPFKIRRIFYEYDLKKYISRGSHANKNSRFCFIAVSGSCDVVVEDGKSKTTYKLDKPYKILYLDNMIWKTMTNFSNNCVLLVLSDSLYDPNEYIRDFEEYLAILNN